MSSIPKLERSIKYQTKLYMEERHVERTKKLTYIRMMDVNVLTETPMLYKARGFKFPLGVGF